MPVPLPTTATADLAPPSAAEVELLSRGVISAAGGPAGLTTLQRLLVRAVFPAMTGHPATFDAAPVGPVDFALGLAARTAEFRTRIVQIMVLVGLVRRPLGPDVAGWIAAFAAELGVEEGMVTVARRFAEGALGLAEFDFARNGYDAGIDDALADGALADVLHTSTPLASAWQDDPADPALAARWAALEQLPAGTLGRRITEFYRARGFAYPGRPGSAPPLLAQHDWVHVLADYGTTVEAELEVFAFIARANDDMRGFSLLAMVVSLFETGYLRTGAGLFEYSPGHLAEEGMAERVADAMRRGALCPGSIDFLTTDWFAVADLSVEAAREHFGVPPKSAVALRAGSVGPWEPGGISPFQLAAGESLAAREGRPYDSFGATVGPPGPVGAP